VLSVAKIGEDRMNKDYILGILFFSGLWGISEAALGGALYRAQVPYASVPLTVIGFTILTFACIYLPQKGTATLIAALAMLYKFLNTPFYSCHLLGILLIGVCYDLFFHILPIKNRSLCSAAAVYLNYAAFALLITYVFGYEHWVQAGFVKVLRHIGIHGSMTALACSVLVPLSYRLSEKLKSLYDRPFVVRLELAPGGVMVLTVALWLFGVIGGY